MTKTFVSAGELLYDVCMNEFLVQNSDIIVRLVVAMCLGMLIGAERVLVHKEAGMKTHALVAMGSAVFVLISEAFVEKYMALPGLNPGIIPAQIIVGIGFLGAGLIMLRGSHLSGLTTASGLWVTAGIGMAAGFGLFSLAFISTVLILMIFVLINILERPIRRISGDIEK